MTYRGIDRCDRCGKVLEKGRWLSGICAKCEEAEKPTKGRPVENVKSTKGVL